jgi:ribonucleoside-diphosphate reductase alpha chain
MKYARYLPEEYRRETFEEITERNMQMHIKRYPHIEGQIKAAYQFVFDRKVLPSMRSMQFGGKPIEIAPNRIFNCAYMPIDDLRSFSEAMFLLLGGTGVGFSVQKHHVEKLPEIRRPSGREKRFLVGDSIEGWADAVRILIQSYFRGTSRIRFDFSDIRPKGARLVTSGGKAPGPQPLVECLVKIDGMLNAKKDGEKLTPIESHDIMCHIADAVLAGGIRRAALISLFSADDDEMIACKSGNWWETNPQRGRANNSAVLLRHKIDKEYFMDLWTRIRESGSGEPGIYFNNDKDWGTNPCCLDGDTIVATNLGQMTIREVVSRVEAGEEMKVLSYDETTNSTEFQLIEEGAMTRTDADVIEIETQDGRTITLTPDHRVYTENRGYVEAAQLTEEDVLLSF